MHATVTLAGHQPITSSFIPASKASLWTARVLTALCGLFLLMDGAMKLALPAPVLASFAPLGLSTSLCVPLGILLLICTVLYLIPQTAFLGAILLTGYLGGAVAIHLRAGNPLFSHILFPVYLGIILWTALALRNSRVRSLAASIVGR